MDRRSPQEEARIAALCVLHDLLDILDQFGRAIERGERRRLVVSEHGRHLGRVIIDITIKDVDP